MNYSKLLLAVFSGIIVLAVTVAAQSPQRARQSQGRAPVVSRPAVARPATSGPTAKANITPPPGALAMVNGQPVLLADIETQVRAALNTDQDPYLLAFFENPEKEMAEARARALDARVNSLLVDAEAKRRKITTEQLLEEEVNSHIPTPSEADIRQVYEENRAQLGSSDLESVRPQIITYLRNKSSAQLYNALATRLRMTNTVTKGANVNTPNLAPSTVLVTVGGREFTAGMLDERLKSYAYKLRLRIYQAEQQALDQKINDMLLLAEAKRRNVPPEDIIRDEITNKIHHPSETDVAKFYQENKERISGTLDETRTQIISYLDQQEQERVERSLSQRLRASADLRVLLTEPDAPVLAVSVDDDPSRGDPNSPVTLVEFTDFQCPACGAMYPVLEEVLKSYGNRVHFVVRDFPLPIHENARKAAEAANAANAQGKFFEYVALLFKNQKTLDVQSLKQYASQVGLDRKRFDTELDSGIYAAEISHDIEDGDLYGVDSTPSIFINGVRLYDLSAEGLRHAIERAFARTRQTKK